MTSSAIMWFRRDLRLADNPALLEAVRRGEGRVLPLFIVDDLLVRRAGPNRVTYLRDTLQALNDSLDGKLVVRRGEPAAVLSQVAREAGATVVLAAKDFAPHALERDRQVREALGEELRLEFVGGPYAIDPGTVTSKTGDPFKVFTAFRRVWETIPLDNPYPSPQGVNWVELASDGVGALMRDASTQRPHYFGDLGDVRATLPAAGEKAALAALENFKPAMSLYGENRNNPGVRGTSKLSPHLRFGSIHPRTIVEGLDLSDEGTRVFVSEIIWREFYADVLFHNPQSVREVLQPSMAFLEVDRDQAAVERFAQWAKGETGYPLVDAGMRQLLATGWMHNRVRMVAASFLVKHLHLDWRWGARWFMWHLVDGDVASNQHGWQWTAGTGTDAAPFHRIFNPTMQAERFDPDGDYVKEFIPALRDVPAPDCLSPGGGTGLLIPAGYVAPCVDAKAEREEALRRFADARERAKSARA